MTGIWRIFIKRVDGTCLKLDAFDQTSDNPKFRDDLSSFEEIEIADIINSLVWHNKIKLHTDDCIIIKCDLEA